MTNCANHGEAAATTFCRTCGKGLCDVCRSEWRGVIFCAECVTAQQSGAAPAYAMGSASSDSRIYSPSPALAFVLGLIPGVGAVYNGQYGKGILHAVVVGLLISIGSSDAAGDLEPLIVFFTIVWFFYMALEAYHTAKKRLGGEPVDEFSSLFPVRPGPTSLPLGPIALIVLGVVFLLNTLKLFPIERILRFWPLLLIAAGVYLLYARLAARRVENGSTSGSAADPEGGAPL